MKKQSGADCKEDSVSVHQNVGLPSEPNGSDSGERVGRKRHDAETTRVSVHEFLVDFLGALVPGILFTTAFTVIIAPMLLALLTVVGTVEAQQLGSKIGRILESTRDTPSAIWIGVFVFCILFSYTLGHLFYRRNPKAPDGKSFRRLSKDLLSKTDFEKLKIANKVFDCDDLAFLEKHGCTKKEYWLRCNFGCDNERDCEFPYPYLDKYLEARGHNHLAQLVPWCGRDRESRSKTFMNRLKIRLEVWHPEACRSIIRNEAHIRLAASMWYAGRFLVKSSIVSLFIFAVLLTLFNRVGMFPMHDDATSKALCWALSAALPAVFVMAFAYYCQYAVERFLLYQRLREAFYVLEVAYTCFRDNPLLLTSPQVFNSE